jgi:hypothetical protein
MPPLATPIKLEEMATIRLYLPTSDLSQMTSTNGRSPCLSGSLDMTYDASAVIDLSSWQELLASKLNILIHGQTYYSLKREAQQERLLTSKVLRGYANFKSALNQLDFRQKSAGHEHLS